MSSKASKGASESSASPPIDMLKCGADNNFPKWRQAMQKLLFEKYGDMAEVTRSNVPYVPPMVEEEDYLPAARDGVPAMSAANIAKLRFEAEKDRNKQVRQIKADLSKMYNTMLMWVSPESEEEIRNHPLYEATSISLNANDLWRIILETHLTAVHGADPQVRNLEKHALRTKFEGLRQGSLRLGEFKVQYDALQIAMEESGIWALSEAESAVTFVSKLDSKRYAAMQSTLANNARTGQPYPATVAAAWRLAMDWVKADGGAITVSQVGAVFVATPGDDAGGEAKEGNHARSRKSRRGGRGTQAGRGDRGGRGSGQPGRSNTRQSATVQGAPTGEVEKRTCRFCMKKGHLQKDCPDNDARSSVALLAGKRTRDADDEEAAYESSFSTGSYMADCGSDSIFHDHEVLLDNQAGRSVFRCSGLLSDIKPVTPWKLSGIVGGGNDLCSTVAEDGVFMAFGRVGLCEGATANLLSAGQMARRGWIVSIRNDVYFLKGSGTTLRFRRKRHPATGRLLNYYVCDMRGEDVLATPSFVTVEENMRRYGKRDVSAAAAARELQRKLGYPPSDVAVKVLRRGVHNSAVTAQDVRMADAIFGADVNAMKGNTRKMASVPAKVVLAPRVTQRQQSLSIDVVFIKDQVFLLGVLNPLNLTMGVHIPDRSSSSISTAVDSLLAAAKARDFDVQVIRTDGEGGVLRGKVSLERSGVKLDVAGPGQHVSIVERKIRHLKEKVRTYEHSLPFVMNKHLLVMCALYCIKCINYYPSATGPDDASPYEQFTGRKLDAKLDLRVGFGDYVQATVPNTDSTLKARTQGCIACLPTGNLTGSVKMFCLTTKRMVTRDQFRVVPMPTQVVALLDELAAADGYSRGRDPTAGANEADPRESVAGPELPDMMRVVERPALSQEDIEDDSAQVPELAQNRESLVCKDIVADPTAQANDERVNEGSGPSIAASAGGTLPDQDEVGAQLRRSGRTTRVPAKLDGAYAFQISARVAMRTRREESLPVIRAELKQMVDKGVWHGIKAWKLSREERKKILRSLMYLKDKRLASGGEDKLKARFVADGSTQDKVLYESLSSPTVSATSILTIAGIAAKEARDVMVCDIGGAYLNADMGPTGVTVHMRLDRVMTELLVEMDPDFQQFVEKNGTSVVALDKALYGCVESASLWYNHLRGTLLAHGMKENEYDCCVFNKSAEGGKQLTVAVYVDDLFCSCEREDGLAGLLAYLRDVYKNVKSKQGKMLDYVGMTFDFREPGVASVTMAACVDELLKGCGVVANRATPATENLFETREAPKASEEEKRWFHSNVAKMLYLAKRVRPECLVAVSFLTTRVHECDHDDLEKLKRLLGYIQATRDRGICIEIGKVLRVRCFIDASYGVHTSSGKSHTGCVVVIGDRGPVYAKSGKQKIVTKSSTEAELVALSDSTGQGILLRNFLVAQGYKMDPVLIYQDNMSTLALVRRGRPGSERSRHINIRYFWVQGKQNDGEIKLQHMPTAAMCANLLTKPVQGQQFVRERDDVTGWGHAQAGSRGVLAGQE